MKSYRYSRWDGSQDPFAIDSDDLMDAMSDELMEHGDLERALQNLMRRGMQGNMGSGFEGLREMLERLKQQQQERLDRYNLASMIDELKERVPIWKKEHYESGPAGWVNCATRGALATSESS